MMDDNKPGYDIDKLTPEEINKKLLSGQLLKRAARLMKMAQIQKALKQEFADIDPQRMDPWVLVNSIALILFNMTEGPELDRWKSKHEKALNEPAPDFEKASFEEINEYLNNSFGKTNRITLELFDLALALNKANKLQIDFNKSAWPARPEHRESLPSYIEVINSSLYNSFRGAISKGDFHLKEGKKWPEADISSGKVKGTAVIRPNNLGPAIEPYLEELRQAMQEKVLDLTKRGDLAADVFDAITARWLKEAKHHESTILITADDMLEARGLKKNPGGSGRRGGYHEERRKEIQQQIDTLSYTWITVKDMDIIKIDEKGKRQVTPWRGESLAVVVSSREGQPKLDGSIDTYSWRVRPGDVFSKFIFGPGRQTALLSQKALNYDPYRQKWEKRLTRNLAWLWRISSGRTQEGLLVKTLVSAAGMEISKTRPGRTRQRLEEALDCLQQNDDISAWHYDSLDENTLKGRGWWKRWAEEKIIILAPEIILEQYKQIKGKH